MMHGTQTYMAMFVCVCGRRENLLLLLLHCRCLRVCDVLVYAPVQLHCTTEAACQLQKWERGAAHFNNPKKRNKYKSKYSI